jgi:hypothetical protein
VERVDGGMAERDALATGVGAGEEERRVAIGRIPNERHIRPAATDLDASGGVKQ